VTQIVLRRLALAIPTLALVSVLDFFLVHLVPGSPADAILGNTATKDQVAQLTRQLHLDDPIGVQYLKWLLALLHGDFGRSLISGQQVTGLIAQRAEVTISLAALSLALAILLGVSAGIASTVRPGAIDRSISGMAAIGIAIPQFFLGLLLAFALAVQIPLFPGAGYVSFRDDVGEFLKSAALPALTLSIPGAAIIARQLRSELTGVLRREYIEYAVAKGLRPETVMVRHALRNAFAPVLTLLGLLLAAILGSTVVIEQIFSLPGLGDLMINALGSKDIPVVQAMVLLSTLVVLVANLAVDLGYAWLNPRVKAG
jgi:peptide/nickel transport system permease protein